MTSAFRSTLIALFGLAFASSAGLAAEFAGKVISVEDGDTFAIEAGDPPKRVDVRLCGIDSPERGKPGYFDAKQTLVAMIKDKDVRCVQVGRGAGTPCDGRSKPKTRKRIAAQCFVATKDVAAEMIKSGVACDWTKFSGGHYKFEPTTCARAD